MEVLQVRTNEPEFHSTPQKSCVEIINGALYKSISIPQFSINKESDRTPTHREESNKRKEKEEERGGSPSKGSSSEKLTRKRAREEREQHKLFRQPHLVLTDKLDRCSLSSTRSKMAFVGTTQKCTACDKTVYLVDRLAADNRVYHKACFRCHHCNCTLKLGNYNSFEGVLYCRHHYDQLFKRTGSLERSFEGISRCYKPEKTLENERGCSISGLFAGTTEKCVCCGKTAYLIEKVSVDRAVYHKSCFKCSYGGCTISPSNYIAHEGVLFCKHHHMQLIKNKGDLSQLESEAIKEAAAGHALVEAVL